MKLKFKLLYVLCFILFVSGIPAKKVEASQATSYTYTLNEKGFFTRTQDAYLPDKTITTLGLLNPDDLYIDKNDMLYIADSGNSRVVIYDIKKGTVAGELRYEEFVTPKGVFVNKRGNLYVTDPSARAIFVFDKNLNMIQKVTKPNEPAFSDTRFEPLRVAVDNGGTMYVIGEGVYNGVIQLAYTGEFLGYFAVNKARLTPVQVIQNFIFNRTQLGRLVPRVPPTFSNIFLDDMGVVYTTTTGDRTEGLKKHNTSGTNMFKEDVFSGRSLVDVWADEQGIIYAANNYGYITVYSKAGEIIFDFGSTVTNLDVSGLYSKLPSVAVDSNRNVWTVDGDKGFLQSFKPTEYALKVYNAMGLYEEGLYEEALTQWNEVLRYNQMSILAHNGVAKAYLRAGLYEEAMGHFKVSGNRAFFSEAYWEVRNNQIQDALPVLIPILFALWLVTFIIKKVDKKRVLRTKRREFLRKLDDVPVLGSVLYSFKIPKNPIDKYYNIRMKRKGSALGATILYALFFILYMLYKTSKGFIYQFVKVEDMDINSIVLGFFAILTLFIICNFLVTSINDGDGTLKQVYMVPAYGLVPLMISMAAITVMSYFLTQNEAFMLTLILYIGIIWSVITIFLGLQTVHDYSTGTTIVSLIITAVFIIIAVIIALIIIIMWEQLYQFLYSIGKEIVRNVIH